MKLEKYNIELTISVPSEPDVSATLKLGGVLREEILTNKFPLAGLLEQFEAAVDDNMEFTSEKKTCECCGLQLGKCFCSWPIWDGTCRVHGAKE